MAEILYFFKVEDPVSFTVRWLKRKKMFWELVSVYPTHFGVKLKQDHVVFSLVFQLGPETAMQLKRAR